MSGRWRAPHRPRRDRAPRLLAVGLAVLGALAAAYYVWQQNQGPTPTTLDLPLSPPLAGPAAEPPAIAHPIAAAPIGHEPNVDEPPATPPPEAALEPGLEEALASVIDSLAQRDLLITDDIVNRVVVTIDNLPNTRLARRFVPMVPVGGAFAVTGGLKGRTISPDNGGRYALHVALFEALDLPALAALYVRHYASFQQAYAALGDPDAYFNDRLVEVIDHLLATPELAAPLAVEQPGVYYKFADPALEARSAGQKALLRMGPANAALVKQRLRELRSLVARAPGG